MIRFRDETMKKYGLQLIEYINQEGVKQGVNPFDYGAAYTDIMKTQALKQALNKYGFTAAFGGGRRDEEKSRAKERIFPSAMKPGLGPEEPASGNVEALQYAHP